MEAAKNELSITYDTFSR